MHGKRYANTAAFAGAALIVLAITSHASGAQSSDDLYAEVGERVPQFAGLMADPTSEGLVLLVTERYEGMVDDVRAAVLDVFPTSLFEGRPWHNVTVLDAEYSFVQLKRWHDLLFASVFNIEGVVLSSIDTRANRLKIAVEDLESQSPKVEEEIAENDIPRDAVIIEAGAAFQGNAASPQPPSSLKATPTKALVGIATLLFIAAVLIAALRFRRRPLAASDRATRQFPETAKPLPTGRKSDA